MRYLLLLAIVYHVLVSAATLVAYALDKHAARRGPPARRIRERTLHYFELAGGWPGALLAQRWLRHKTVDPSYRPWFWLCVVGHCAIVAGITWVLTRF